MEVEVVFPQVCGAFYKATIVELEVEQHRALLSFEDSWKPNTWADLDHIRFLPLPPADTFIQPGSTVEALLPHQDNEPPGWWNGTLLKSKGELHVVEFQSGNEKYQDIVDEDKIRSPNINEPLSKCKFHRQEFPVPEDIQTFCVKQTVHENFRKRIEAICVHYDQDKKSLIVQAGTEGSLKRAALLIDIHLNDLHTQKQLMTRADMAAQREQQQQQRQLESGIYEQQVFVASDLVGLAIGRDGHNVNDVRKLDGILSVEFEDYNQMFRVRAKTPEVLTRAKELLEITRETVMIPRNLAGRVIGKRGHVIQQILEKSGVHNIRVLGDDETSGKTESSTTIPFDFIGRKSAVENAVLMLNYHLDHLKGLESILQSRGDLDDQSAEEPPLQSHFPAPHRGGYRKEGGGKTRENDGRYGGWGGGGGGEGGGWGERGRGRGRGGRGRGGDWDRGGRRGDYSERPPPESDSPNPPPPAAAQSRDEDVEYYHSSDESNTEDEEEEEEEEQRNGQGNSEEEQSPPETDEQGPDRRRQQSAGRPQRGSWGGGRRGGYSRGRGGWGWRGRGGGGGGGGRGRGRGTRGKGWGGYQNSRPQQQQREDAPGTTNWDNTDATKPDEQTTSRGSAPKPQRTGRGGGYRRRNTANDTANTAPTGNTNTPDTAEP